MNKKIITPLICLAIVALACGGTVPSASQPNLETVVAATLQAITQQAANNPAATSQPEATGISVSFQNVQFVIPEGLASGASSEVIPAADEASGGPWGVAPEYIEFVLMDYSPRDEFRPPVIRIYPAQEYAAVNSWAQSSLAKLQGILASPSMPLTNENLPTIPFNGAAAQQYAAQAKIISFANGSGVRMTSQYAQFPGPILKDGSYYHYEGLTNDGKYMVAIMVPVTLPIQATAENPSADGVVYPSDISDTIALDAYFQGVTDLLNAATPDSFQPNLNVLDALIQSIQIK
ncbi:MAG TPA: hypothetical protein PKJ84_08555 [Anaerolineales bacterium]|nr:hypothetical protein [Anaerolineales bacterium]HNO94208.1 hypothetical protein [Anaerolineales bacterium]